MSDQRPSLKNAADEGQVKEADKRQKLEQDQIKDDLKHLLRQPQFRRLVYRYLAFTKVFAQVFTGNSETFFNDGKRVVGLKLIDEVVSADPNAYVQILTEKGA